MLRVCRGLEPVLGGGWVWVYACEIGKHFFGELRDACTCAFTHVKYCAGASTVLSTVSPSSRASCIWDASCRKLCRSHKAKVLRVVLLCFPCLSSLPGRQSCWIQCFLHAQPCLCSKQRRERLCLVSLDPFEQTFSPLEISLGSFMDKVLGRRTCSAQNFTEEYPVHVLVMSWSCLGHISITSSHVQVLFWSWPGSVSQTCPGHVNEGWVPSHVMF